MSQESQDALIDLLISIDREDKGGDWPDFADLSMHDQKRTRKQFLNKLVRKYERIQLQQRYNAPVARPPTCQGVSTMNRGHQPSLLSHNELPYTSTRIQSANPNVRIEIAEAVFSKEKELSRKKTGDDKGKSKKKGPSDKFKIGAKKVIVLPRTTSIPELLKLSQTKLKLKKKPICAFLKTSTSWSIPFELINNLGTIDDGTLVFVSILSLPTETHSSDEETDIVEKVSGIVEPDPLESVKRAYERQELYKRKQLCQRMGEIIDDSQRSKYAEIRERLPVAPQKQLILNTIENNQVVVLSGSTGSGKSTQVPQFIMDQGDNDRLRPYIVITQPRRVAAISLAQRVAAERGCPTPGSKGSSVGYMVRMDTRVDLSSCRVVYMTIGILLRMLVRPQTQTESTNLENNIAPPISMDTISHLIIDEVHERDVNTDFVLALLRDMMLTKSSANSIPRLILMSATTSVDLFVRYFTGLGGATPAAVEVPGKTFPVDIKWLSDCEKFAGKQMFFSQPRTELSNSGTTKRSHDFAFSPCAKDRIDNQFIRTLITKIVQHQQMEESPQAASNGNRQAKGAILVFLPGLSEQNALATCLCDKESITGDPQICTILKLHSSTSKANQELVFQPSSKYKIILSTNIAETSLTINDISHVIDTCLVKESRYNSKSRIKELVTVWTSQSSMKQRSGRAGRTSHGVCWRLCTEDFAAKQLLQYTLPEVLRTSLDELILNVLLLHEHRRGKSGDKEECQSAAGIKPIIFLSSLPTPPPEANLAQACRHLLDVGALSVVDRGEIVDDLSQWVYRLSPLGYHLSSLPMDAKVGKLLIVGCITGCLDNALTIAAALSCSKSCFLHSTNNQPLDPECVEAREILIENGFGGKDWIGGTVKGDLIAVIAVYRAWKMQKSCNKNKFCRDHCLDNFCLQELDLLRYQFRDLVIDAGLAFNAISHTGDKIFDWDDSNFANEDAIVTSCCLVAGLYPNVCTLIRPSKGGSKTGRLLTKETESCRPSFASFQGKRVKHASETGKDVYAVYFSKEKTIGIASHGNQRPPEIFLTEVNFISKFALLLFGGELDLKNNALIVDFWLKFKVSGHGEKSKRGDVNNAVLILSLRQLMDDVILEHVQETFVSQKEKKQIIARHMRVVDVIRQLLRM